MGSGALSHSLDSPHQGDCKCGLDCSAQLPPLRTGEGAVRSLPRLGCPTSLALPDFLPDYPCKTLEILRKQWKPWPSWNGPLSSVSACAERRYGRHGYRADEPVNSFPHLL